MAAVEPDIPSPIAADDDYMPTPLPPVGIPPSIFVKSEKMAAYDQQKSEG